MPTDTEVSTMETLVEVLKPIVDITEAFGGEKLASISTINHYCTNYYRWI